MKESQPNIVLILADDTSFTDIGCFGSEIRTANLDKLAEDGISTLCIINWPGFT